MKIRILIVEDDEIQFLSFKKILEEYFPDCILIGNAENVDDAVLMCYDLLPDLVFLDIELNQNGSNENGLNLISKVSQHPNCPYIAIFTNFTEKYSLDILSKMQSYLHRDIKHIQKPYIRAKIAEIMEYVRADIAKNQSLFFRFRMDGMEFFVKICDIVKVSRWEDHYCKILYFKDGKILEDSFVGEFPRVAERLRIYANFNLARKGTIVNIYHLINLKVVLGTLHLEIPFINNSSILVNVSDGYLMDWRKKYGITRFNG